MSNSRINQIKESLKGLGTNSTTMYTNQEIVDHLSALQGALARGVFEKTHAENLRERDIMIHFEALAKEYGLDSSETFLRFKANMKELGYTIGSFIKGMNGERIAKRALKLLNYEKGVRILYNVQLEDEDAQAEYDAIIITTYGMFVVEVKNWGAAMTLAANGLLTRDDDSGIVYDLPGRMSVKEALLREYLGDKFPAEYHSMLLLSNERAQIRDEYHKIPICCGGGIAYEIKGYAKVGKSMTAEQVNSVADEIISHHKEQKTVCDVNCQDIIEDYAFIMDRIEQSSAKLNEDGIILKKKTERSEIPDMSDNQKANAWYRRINWGSFAASLAAVVIPSVVTAVVVNKK